MLDLSQEPELPRYDVKLPSGEIKSYDPVLVGYEFRLLEGIEDPKTIREVVNKALGVEFSAFQALQILEDFTTFAEENIQEPLKKVFGRELSSTITTGSRPENSETSDPESTSD